MAARRFRSHRYGGGNGGSGITDGGNTGTADDGKFDDKNLSLTKTDRSFFEELLHEQGIRSVRRVFVLTMDGTGKIYLQCRGEKYRSFRIGLPEGSAW